MTMTKRITALLLVLLLTASMVLPVIAAETKVYTEDDPEIVELREKAEEAREEAEAAKAERAELDAQISEEKASAKEIQSQVTALQKEISAYQKQIDAFNAEIDALNTKIEEIGNAVVEQKAKIEETQILLGKRLRAMYMAGNMSTLEQIFNATGFEDLLNRIELVSQISAHDTKIVENLRAEITEYYAMLEQLEEDKVTLQTSKDELVAAQAEVKTAKAAVDKKLSKLQSTINSLAADSKELAEIEAEAEEKESEYSETIANMLKGIASEGSGTADLIWPVNNKSSYISSKYGMRTLDGTTKLHKGIDIALKDGSGPTGNVQILAAGSGKVLLVDKSCTHNYKKHYTCCNSYGRYLVLDNGDGVTTYYAHLDSIYVSVGDYVTKGQVIATMGCTGHSTGWHLHFEVRINGSPKNPSNYVSK